MPLLKIKHPHFNKHKEHFPRKCYPIIMIKWTWNYLMRISILVRQHLDIKMVPPPMDPIIITTIHYSQVTIIIFSIKTMSTHHKHSTTTIQGFMYSNWCTCQLPKLSIFSINLYRRYKKTLLRSTCPIDILLVLQQPHSGICWALYCAHLEDIPDLSSFITAFRQTQNKHCTFTYQKEQYQSGSLIKYNDCVMMRRHSSLREFITYAAFLAYGIFQYVKYKLGYEKKNKPIRKLFLANMARSQHSLLNDNIGIKFKN